MLPILRSVVSRSVVSRRSFNTAAPTNGSALKEKFGGAWPYIGPLAGVGVGYGIGGIILGDKVTRLEEARLEKLLRKARGESVEIVDLREKMWTGYSNREATWEWLKGVTLKWLKGHVLESLSFSRKS